LGKTRNSFRILVWKLLGKQPLERLTRWEDNIKMDHVETDCKDGRRIELAQDHVQ
jgi:hypothetical protein